MSFKNKYEITPRYLTSKSKRRPGLLITKGVHFIVAHDTGNPGSTARNNVNYYENSRNQISASAHLFVDDKEILECIPALTGPPEKAWHVLYRVTKDNELFGFDANDAAIGVEYCYGSNINADEAYKRYIWVMAKICSVFELDPVKSITGHFILDPGRKSDPASGLAKIGRTFQQLLRDVVAEFEDCAGKNPTAEGNEPEKKGGKVRVIKKLNIRKGGATTKAPIERVAPAGSELYFVDILDDGERIDGVSRWFQDPLGCFFWGGAVQIIN